MRAETILRDTCRAILAIEKVAPVRRRPYEGWEVKAVARLYLEEKLTLREMCALISPPRTSVSFVDLCQDARERSQASEDISRRNAKVIEAILMGDSRGSIARRWGLSQSEIHDVLLEYRGANRIPRNRWRRIFLRRSFASA